MFFLLFALPAQASDWRQEFIGTWGTSEQCSGALIKEGGTVRYKPFEIGEQWLRHGQLWCRIEWGPLERREDELFTGVTAKCGEDAVQGYFLSMKKRDEKLILRWNLTWSNGSLQRCPVS